MRSLIALILAGLVVCAAACLADRGVDDGVQIACTGDRECPSGFACQETLERCVAAEDLDDEAPHLVTAALDPPVARADTPVTLVLESSEPLLTTPVIRMPDAAGTNGFALDSHPDARHWRFATTVFGGPSGTRSIEVDLVDAHGVRAGHLAIPAMVVDVDPPALTSIQCEPLVLIAGSTLECVAGVNEPALDSATRATLTRTGGGSVELAVNTDVQTVDPPPGGEPDGLSFAFGLVFEDDGSAPREVWHLSVAVTDAVGNSATLAGPDVELQ